MERDWLTVPEAAKYLGKSEPTIFRWMRDGVLSYYKVGRATRFKRESLDAVVEKTTGRSEAAEAAGRCAACGHSGLREGRLQSTGRIYFRPNQTRFWTTADSMVGLNAKVCPACGFVQLHADVAKLSRLLPGETE